MKVITFLNEKGGVGKTTLALHLAAGMALRGYRVLIIDADAQGTATRAIGLQTTPGLYNIVVRNEAWKTEIKRVPRAIYTYDESAKSQLYALPSNEETRLIPLAIGDDLIFYQRLSELQSTFDYVVIDTSPTPSLFHPSIVLASDYILIPTQPEAYSAFQGLTGSLLHTDRVYQKTANAGIPKAQAIGIIPNMYRKKTIAHKQVLDNLQRQYGELVWSPVDQAIAFAEAALMQKLLYAFDNPLNAHNQLNEILDRTLAVAGV